MAGLFPRAAAACAWLLVALVSLTNGSQAQPAPAPAAADWKQFEKSQPMTDYRTALREGVFDDGTRAFLVKSALPQLGLPANRGSIERVRRRMRELICGDPASEPKALDAALQTIAGFMTTSARNEREEPLVRINALLLVGELKGKDGRPWPGAMAPLADAASEATLPLALRIVATQGLARHVDVIGPAAAPTVGPVLVKLLASLPQMADRDGAEWIAARTLAMVADLGPSAPPEAARLAATILDDAALPPTLRARAATAVAAAAPKAAGIDVSKAVAACRTIAVAALEAEKARGARVRELALIGPTTAAGPGAAGNAEEASLSCRRVAWVLATLADALAGSDDRGGMATLGGGHQQAARDLATPLRQAAKAIDASPNEASIIAAMGLLAGGQGPGAAQPPTTTPPGFNPLAQ